MSVEVGEYRLDCAIYRNRIFIESLHARMLIKNNINGKELFQVLNMTF